MEQPISEIRLEIITNEYLREISKLKVKYSKYLDFPFLTEFEFYQAFLNKKIGVRSNLRIISLSILCGYASTSLNQDYANKINSLVLLDDDELNELKKNDPLIFILINLFRNKEDLELANQSLVSDFESFLYHERYYRSKKKFKDLLYFVDETSNETLTTFLKSAKRSNAQSMFWKSFATKDSDKRNITNLQFYISTIELLDFINTLSEFLTSVTNQIVRSAFWFYYKNFVTAFEIVSEKMILFTKGLLDTIVFSEYFNQIELSTEDRNQFIRNQNEEITRTSRNIKWITNASNHSSLERFIQSDNDYVYAFANSFDLFESPFNLDVSRLRQFLQGD